MRFESDRRGDPHEIRLDLTGTTRDARATQLASLEFLDAFGVSRNRFAVWPVEGSGSVRAAVRTGPATRFDLGLELADGSYAKEPFASAVLDLTVGDHAV